MGKPLSKYSTPKIVTVFNKYKTSGKNSTQLYSQIFRQN